MWQRLMFTAIDRQLKRLIHERNERYDIILLIRFPAYRMEE